MKKAGWEKNQISFMDELDRYELEKEGRSYVSQRLAEGYSGTIEKEFEKDGYRLEIEAGTEDGSYTVRKWKITREWVQDEHIEGLWPGQ